MLLGIGGKAHVRVWAQFGKLSRVWVVSVYLDFTHLDCWFGSCSENGKKVFTLVWALMYGPYPIIDESLFL